MDERDRQRIIAGMSLYELEAIGGVGQTLPDEAYEQLNAWDRRVGLERTRRVFAARPWRQKPAPRVVAQIRAAGAEGDRRRSA